MMEDWEKLLDTMRDDIEKTHDLFVAGNHDLRDFVTGLFGYAENHATRYIHGDDDDEEAFFNTEAELSEAIHSVVNHRLEEASNRK